MVLKPLVLAWLSVLVVAGLGIWGWFLYPEYTSRWAFAVFVLPALLAFIELTFSWRTDLRDVSAIIDWHRYTIAWVGMVMALKAGFQLAISADLLDASWVPIGQRIRAIIFGVGMVIWGNYLPKNLSPWSLEDEPFDWQRVHRFVGWVASLGGIAFVMVWLVLPPESARLASIGIVGTACVLAAGRKLISVVAYSRQQPQ